MKLGDLAKDAVGTRYSLMFVIAANAFLKKLV